RYSRPIKAMNVKKDDEMIFVGLITPEKELLLTTYFSYTLRFKIDEIPVTGVRTAGVKGLNLKEEDYLVSVHILEPDSDQDMIVVTHRGAIKRMNESKIELSTRAKRGVVILKELKSNPHPIFNVSVVDLHDTVTLTTTKQLQETIEVSKLTRSDRYSNGSLKFDTNADGELLFVKIQPKEEETKE